MTVIRLTRLFLLLTKEEQPSKGGNRQAGFISVNTLPGLCSCGFRNGPSYDYRVCVSCWKSASASQRAPDASTILTALQFSGHKMTFAQAVPSAHIFSFIYKIPTLPSILNSNITPEKTLYKSSKRSQPPPSKVSLV